MAWRKYSALPSPKLTKIKLVLEGSAVNPFAFTYGISTARRGTDPARLQMETSFAEDMPPAEQEKVWFAPGGKVEGMLAFMGNMFATAENPALSDYSKTIDTSFLPHSH